MCQRDSFFEDIRSVSKLKEMNLKMKFPRRVILTFVVVVSVLIKTSNCSVDPCLAATQIGDSRRTTTEDPGTCGGICDNYILDGSWYRLDVSNSGARMPESCVPIWSCGTYIPIWLNGPHPTAASPGPVTIQVCAQLSNTGSCCEWRSTISVKRCADASNDEYFVYQLNKTPFCDMAYCAGSGPNCASGSWNDILNNCTSTASPSSVTPTLSNPYISQTVSVKDNNGNAFTAKIFSLKCQLSYTMLAVDNGARYEVSFNTDDLAVLYTYTLKSTDAPVVVMAESYLAGHIDHSVTCRVRTYWQSQYPKRSAYVVSNAVYIGITFSNSKTNVVLTQPISVQEGDRMTINIQPSFPITTPACVASPGSPCFPSYSFRVYTSQLYLSSCSVSITGGSTASFTFSPIANIDWIPRRGSFYVVADNTVQAQGSIFNGYTSKTYSVSIVERTWSSCNSIGDPHVKTYVRDDYWPYYYGVYDVGQYVLTSISSRKITVQTSHTPCNGGSVTCNCGVIAREGNNMIGIDNCPPRTSPAFNRYLKDVNNPGGYIQSIGGQPRIVLPSGMFIDVAIDTYNPNVIHVYATMYGIDNNPNIDLCSHTGTGICGSDCNKYRVQGTNFFRISSGAQSICANDAILVPQCDCSNGGVGSSCRMPTGGITLIEMSNTCSQGLQNRRKRDATSVTTTPAPFVNAPPPVQTWPTPNKHITQQAANDSCSKPLIQSTFYNLCVTQLKVDITALINLCILDIQILEDLNGPPSSMSSQLGILCNLVIESSNNASTQNMQREQFYNQACPNQCSSRGSCSNGNCACNSGYVGSDCSVLNGTVPHITRLESPVCDTSANGTEGCNIVYIVASNVTDNVICQFTGGTQPSYDTQPEVQAQFNSVICHLPSSLSVSSDKNACYHSTNVSLSNDGIKYGNSMKFTVYDGYNVTCDGSGCIQKMGSRCSADRNVATATLLLFIYIFFKLIN